jgi:tRNA modification GTPase
VVGTHLDLASSLPGVDCAISNTQGDGLDSLRQAIREHLQGPRSGEQVALFSQRQYDLVCRLAEHTDAARGALLGELGPAVAAEEVHGALQRLAELSGGDPREEVLDRLFSRFCIGK